VNLCLQDWRVSVKMGGTSLVRDEVCYLENAFCAPAVGVCRKTPAAQKTPLHIAV